MTRRADVGFEVPGYTLQRAAGSGAMGEVFFARHERTGAPVAIKRMPPTDNPRLLAFRQSELRATAGLDHPHIVRVVDLGTLEDSAMWMALEWCGGGTLADVGDSETLLAAIREVLGGLAHAHARRVLHRDLKPANILRDEAGHFKLADFGVSHIGSHGASRAIVGTPSFIAPEVAGRRPELQGPWSDLYSLGCTVWNIVCGREPFEGPAMEVLRRQQCEPLPPLEPRFEIPPHLEGWIRRLVEKDPRARPRTAAEALRELDGRPRPRLSPTFSHGTAEGRDSRFKDAGLSVLPLRTLPFRGRADALQLLWSTLRAVDVHRAPQVVVVTGEEGIGRTRLGTHFGEQIEERGLARYGVARFDDGLTTAPLEQLFGELSTRRIRRWLGDEIGLVVLDGCDAVMESLARFVRDTPVPVLWVLTASAWSDAAARQLPGALVQHLELGPLPKSAFNPLLKDALPLAAAARVSLLDRSRGVPGRAVRTLATWIDECRLSPTEDGYVLGPGVPRSELYSIGTRHALELLGLAGGALEVDLWQRAVEAGGWSLDWDELTTLVNTGRARLVHDGRETRFELDPAEDFEYLADRGRASGVLKDSAAYLAEHVGVDDPRLGAFEHAAGRYERALIGYRNAIRAASRRSDSPRALALADRALDVLKCEGPFHPELVWSIRLDWLIAMTNEWRHQRSADRLAGWSAELASATTDQRIAFWRRLANIYKFQGDRAGTLEAVERAVAVIERGGVEDSVRSSNLQACADELVSMGFLDMSEDLAHQALDAATDAKEEALAEMTLSRIASARLDTEAMLGHVERSLALTEPDSQLACTLHMMLGETQARCGNHEAAERSLQRAHEINHALDRSPLVMVDLNLAALALHREDWQGALRLCLLLEHDPRVLHLAIARLAVAQMATVAVAGLQRWTDYGWRVGVLASLREQYPDVSDPDFTGFARTLVALVANRPLHERGPAEQLLASFTSSLDEP